VEQLIIGKLQEILSTDLPNILSGRKQLDRLLLELDTNKARLEKGKEEELHGAPGAAQRLERLVEELDDTARKVDQARDTLAADMLIFLSRDSELAGLVGQYLDFRLTLHQDNAAQLAALKPQLDTIRSTRRGFPIFGSSLRDHIASFGLDSGIAYPLQLCVTKLIELGLEEEGLFRLAAGSSKVKRLRAEIEAGQATLTSLEHTVDHHVLTAMLKSYLRELPTPLLCEEFYTDWLETAELQGEDRLEAIWNLLQQLPRDNFKNVHYLFKFLHEVTLYSEKNKMTASNLAIVITPNVIWSTEAVQDVMDVSAGSLLAQVVELIIQQQAYFFQNESRIVWNEKLVPLGTCIPLSNSEQPAPSLNSGLANIASIPMGITSSPLPASRDKNKKHKKAPAPPAVTSLNFGESGSASPAQVPHSAPPTGYNNGAAVSPPGSPVALRKGSPGLGLRASEVQRSRSVEGHRSILQHPSHPPPKPPTPRASMEHQLGGSSSESSSSRSLAESRAMKDDSGEDTGSSQENLLNLSGGQSVQNKGQQQQHGVPSVQHSGGVYTNNLYPDLNQELDPELESADRQFPVPAPRFSKPALPSKPEGLARNMSMRSSGGSGGSTPDKSKDVTKL